MNNIKYYGCEWVSEWVCVSCVCVYLYSCLSYPALKAHAPYDVICGPSGPYFSILSHKRHDFRGVGEVIDHKMFVLICYTNCVWNFSHSKKNEARFYHKSIQIFLVRCPLFVSNFNETRITSTDFRKILKLNFMKIRPVGAELFHDDRRTDKQRDRDMTKVIVLFTILHRV